MPIISPTLPNDGETIDAQDVNGPFNAILSVLNGNIDDQNVKPGSLPWSVMDSFSNQIPASAMQDSGNLEKFREDSNISFIPDGLIWSATTGLAGAMTSGSYYSNSGVLLPVTAIASKTFTASKDTYVSIAQNGAIAYSEVANGAAQPSLPSNSNWLAKVVTSGSAVTSVTDMRQTAPIASHNVDFTTQGKIWWEEIGRINVGVATSTINISNLPKRRYLKFILSLMNTGGTINVVFTVNNNTGSNYSYSRDNVVNAVSGLSTVTSNASIQLMSAARSAPTFIELSFFNNIDGYNNKLFNFFNVEREGTTAADNTNSRQGYGCVIESNAITSMEITNSGTGNYAVGSQVIVMGHD